MGGNQSTGGVISTGMTIRELLGESFIDHNKAAVTASAINTDLVLVYFSAHWCPPCRGFTPVLSKFYTDAKAANKSISVVFMSRDSDEKSMLDYFGTMSFNVALPHNDPKIQGLMSKWGIRGIPTLVVLDKNGNIVSPNGRGDVQSKGVSAIDAWLEASKAAAAPAATTGSAGTTATATTAASTGTGSLQTILGTGKLVGKKGEEIDNKAAEADYTCIYFSAHWCPPCRGFTPALSEFYTKAKEAGKSVSIIFASRDSDESSFQEYFNTMSFPHAFPFGDDRVQGLMTKWGIRGIPTLVVLDRSGNVIRPNGRPDVQMHGIAALDAWAKPPST